MPPGVASGDHKVPRPHRGDVPMKGDTMTTNKALTVAVTAIRDALATEAALEDARKGMRKAWDAAYAATRAAQDAGQTQADIGKAAKVSPATVGDYLTASGIHASAWDVLETLPARQGVRFTSLHSLVAGARKASGTPAVREIIADAAGKVRDIPREDGAAPDADRVARVWAAAVRKLWDASAVKAKKVTPPPPPPNTGEGGTGEGEGGEGGTTTPPVVTDTLHARALRLAAECGAVRLALTGDASGVSRDALVALQRESAALAREVAGMLAPAASKAAG